MNKTPTDFPVGVLDLLSVYREAEAACDGFKDQSAVFGCDELNAVGVKRQLGRGFAVDEAECFVLRWDADLARRIGGEGAVVEPRVAAEARICRYRAVSGIVGRDAEVRRLSGSGAKIMRLKPG